MPITPRFTVTQDDAFLYVKIAVPHIRVSDAEFLVADEALHFYCKPYLLRLRFSGSLVEDERAKAVFDAEDVSACVA
jgi:protein SHQ1